MQGKKKKAVRKGRHTRTNTPVVPVWYPSKSELKSAADRHTIDWNAKGRRYEKQD
jgi:hypothetical protein